MLNNFRHVKRQMANTSPLVPDYLSQAQESPELSSLSIVEDFMCSVCYVQCRVLFVVTVTARLDFHHFSRCILGLLRL